MRLYLCIRVPNELGEIIQEKSQILWEALAPQWFDAWTILCKITTVDLPGVVTEEDLAPIKRTMLRMASRVRPFELHFQRFRVSDKSQVCLLADRDDSFMNHFVRLVEIARVRIPNAQCKLDTAGKPKVPDLCLAQLRRTWMQHKAVPPLELREKFSLPITTIVLTYVDENHTLTDIHSVILQ